MEQDFHGQALGRADLPVFAVGGNVLFGPRAVAVRLIANAFCVRDWVVSAHTGRDRVVHHGGKAFAKIRRCSWCRRHLVNNGVNMLALHPGNRTGTVFARDKAVEHAAVNSLRRGRQRLEFDAAIVPVHSGSDRTGLQTVRLDGLVCHGGMIRCPEFLRV
nr:hypothetical protein [Mesorhizobium hawassense]